MAIATKALVPSLDIEAVTVEQFYNYIQHENNLLLLDVRNEDSFKQWQIESRHTPQTLNIFYANFFDEDFLEETYKRIPHEREIVVLCARGDSSELVADDLRDEGITAANLAGGMKAWGNFYVFRPVVETDAYQVYQVERPSRGCLSHILISNGQAVIIDPLRHTEKYHQFLTEKDASLALILDTHAHADHISGGPALAEATGAPYYLHPYDAIHPFDMLPAQMPYEILYDGQTLTMGDFEIRVLHVPGHTLGQVNFLATAQSDGEVFFFTGDNLFIKSFGRPDLGGRGDTWAPLVYQTIFETVKQNVPDTAWVLPGHYAQHNEANQQGLYIQRLGALWQENEDLHLTDKNAFLTYVLSHLPEMPQQYIQIKRVNNGLAAPDELEASELELGKNICALSDAY